jgi:hypothetical protein
VQKRIREELAKIQVEVNEEKTRVVDLTRGESFGFLGLEFRRRPYRVAVDLDDPQSLGKAFSGAHGAYCVTFYWEHFSPEKEAAHARALASVAKDAGLAHVIWSTIEDTRKLVPLSDDRMPTFADLRDVNLSQAKMGGSLLNWARMREIGFRADELDRGQV